MLSWNRKLHSKYIRLDMLNDVLVEVVKQTIFFYCKSNFIPHFLNHTQLNLYAVVFLFFYTGCKKSWPGKIKPHQYPGTKSSWKWSIDMAPQMLSLWATSQGCRCRVEGKVRGFLWKYVPTCLKTLKYSLLTLVSYRFIISRFCWHVQWQRCSRYYFILL